jgi:uncharacterized protein
LRAQNDTLMDVFNDLTPAPVEPGKALDATPLEGLRQQLASTFDKHLGGFGGAPKFPHPGSIDRLMHHWHSRSAVDDSALREDAVRQRRVAGELCGGRARYG